MDIFSIGCVVFELLTGETPWANCAESINKLAFGITGKKANYTEFEDIFQMYSPECKDFIKKCLTKEPEKRPTA